MDEGGVAYFTPGVQNGSGYGQIAGDRDPTCVPEKVWGQRRWNPTAASRPGTTVCALDTPLWFLGPPRVQDAAPAAYCH